MTWSLESQRQFLYPVPLLGGGHPEEAIYSPNPGPKQAAQSLPA